jgi:hypothetical protein
MPDPAVRLTMNPECRCWTYVLSNLKNADAVLTFFQALLHFVFVHLLTHLPPVVNLNLCISVHGMLLLKIYSFALLKLFSYAKMPDCPASGQFGTAVKKKADAGTSSVPK